MEKIEKIIPGSLLTDSTYLMALKFLYSTSMDDDGLIEFFLDLPDTQHENCINKIDHFEPCSIKLPEFSSTSGVRKPSCREFSFKKNNALLSDTQILNLLSSLIQPDGRRQYPSAGGLYPINLWVTIFPERVNTELKEGIYLYDASTKSLEMKMKCNINDLMKSFHYTSDGIKSFSFGIIFTVDIYEAIKKYKLRGLLMSAMEVGAIYQDLTRTAEKNDLRTLVYGGFRVHSLSKNFGFNQLYHFPLMMQLFGYEK